MRIKQLKLLERGNFLAVSIEEMIFQLRAEEVDFPDPSIQRTALQANISAAASWVESYTGHTLVDATYQVSLDAFPLGDIELPLFPLREVVAVGYKQGGADQDIDTSAIDADLNALRPRLRSLAGWPVTDSVFNAVAIKVKAGYEDAVSIPFVLKAAVMMLATHLHENAAATSVVKLEEVPLGVRALADSERVTWL